MINRFNRITWLSIGLLVLSACSGSDDTSDVNSGGVTPVELAPGQEIYQNYCFSCHAPGLSGAPRLGDVEAWAPRIAKGPELLLQATIEGIPPAMPARGICMSCTDEELAATVDYMIRNSQ
ncbi:MAG: cytochrome c5 family protein [Gammaproteobacteria bacterium]|nr:cytochrome c5 family protein [Gammaproteobacteria bacterium]